MQVFQGCHNHLKQPKNKIGETGNISKGFASYRSQSLGFLFSHVTFGAEMVDLKFLRLIASLSEVKKLPAEEHNAAVLLRNCERRFCKPSLGLDIFQQVW